MRFADVWMEGASGAGEPVGIMDRGGPGASPFLIGHHQHINYTGIISD